MNTTSIVLLLLNLVITALVVVGMIQANQFASLLVDFDSEVPWWTEVMQSSWVITGLVVLAIGSIAKELLMKEPRLKLMLNAVHLPLLLIVWQLHLEARWLPFIKLIESLR